MKIKHDGHTYDLNPERILTNDVTFPHEYNPHNVRLWLIGNEYGPVCAVWADCEQDALDEATDAGLMDNFLVDEEDVDPEMDEAGEYSYLGNAGETADLTNAWMHEIDLAAQGIQLIVALAEARGAQVDNLDEI